MVFPIKKLIQKHIYNILSNNKYVFILLLLLGCILTSGFYFGKAIIVWVDHQHTLFMHKLENNLAQKPMQDSLCDPLPIDVVYTWVNGSDPLLVKNLEEMKQKYKQTNHDSDALQSKCSFNHCMGLPVILLVPPLLFYQKIILHTFYKESWKIQHIDDITISSHNVTIVYIDQDSDWKLNISEIKLNNTSFSLHSLFITSDSTSKGMMSDQFLLFKDQNLYTTKRNVTLMVEDSLTKWTSSVQKIIHWEESVVILLKTDRYSKDIINVLTDLNGTTALVKTDAYLVWDLDNKPHITLETSSNRFYDNEELRYSIRSLELHAPWIHHIFLVTNGQVPSWLNIDHPRITVVPHSVIFTNTSHLPTFSSPAIEANLHRIPGLSRFFIYMNDDVFFAKPVTPSDFLSKAAGYQVYLSYNVPNCREGCPNNWLKDGYCDKACNYSLCFWDGGDCLGSGPASLPGNIPLALVGGGGVNLVNGFGGGGQDPMNFKLSFCSAGCPDGWLGDRYCDMPCNVAACGFDVGDCGTTNTNRLSAIFVTVNTTDVFIAPGDHVFYLDLSSFSSTLGPLVSGEVEKHEHLRVVVLALKYQFLFVVTTDKSEDNSTSTGNHSLPLSQQNAPFAVTVLLKGEVTTGKEYLKNLTLWFNSNNTNTSPDFLPSSEISNSALHEPLFTGYSALYKFPQPVFKTPISNVSLDLSEVRLGVNSRVPTPTDLRLGFMPWERHQTTEQQDMHSPTSHFMLPSVSSRATGRHLLDSYLESLRHSDYLLSSKYGFQSRKVLGHMPHFIDKTILQEAQDKFQLDWTLTSSHQIRSSDDLQFAYIYYHYLMNEKRNRTAKEVLQQLHPLDTGFLNEESLRSLAAQMYKLPLDEKDTLETFRKLLFNCTHMPAYGANQTSYLPVPVSSLLSCPSFLEISNASFPPVNKYRFHILDDSQIWFKMVTSNSTVVRRELDTLVKEPRKFLCLNDDVQKFDKESMLVRRMVASFLTHLYPTSSQFELPSGQHNQHLYLQDYSRSKLKFDVIKYCIYCLLGFILFRCLCPSKYRSLRRRCCRKHRATICNV